LDGTCHNPPELKNKSTRPRIIRGLSENRQYPQPTSIGINFALFAMNKAAQP
jgi:hypothetical protein